MDINGMAAIVTGGGSGLGEATARRLAAAGAKVACFDVNEEAANNVAGEIGGIGVNELQVFTPDPDACAANSEDFLGIKGQGAVYGYGHRQMYEDILAFAQDGVPYPVSRDDCLNTLKLLHAFYRSDEDGGWVEVASGTSSDRLGRPNEAISDLYRTPPPKEPAP